ncbi:MAG: hypothetical protein P5702_00360 [Limnospira sp. PMC 1291.21]|uniref:Uncharacterized protein n=1 Tax=Limnospira fusiformis PMC 851.14 TaxID=2219512 RepID=A0ABU9EJY9_LIMFS|nr:MULTISPECIES: hypothetical protein [Limnospira]EKD07415.1 hypothetical protein SPLC1_S410820 [Arthrospira platensis C1]MDC0838644.1 hypothetical protein [Limnoraphis robusta]MDT9247595.1 hypothetical protein [Limnospira sp. PMC 1280.21]MDY7052249.1 hypothetical protein [Limnospira fusiformis LS22]MDT9176026.1 hypothetical protein [Limnospira sp. PMC 1238.20]
MYQAPIYELDQLAIAMDFGSGWSHGLGRLSLGIIFHWRSPYF